MSNVAANAHGLDAFEQVKKEWVDTGKVRYYSRDFPLDFQNYR